MADARGEVRTLTVLTPIADGREPSLREALERLPRREESPLARLPGTHFARWVVVPELAALLFSSAFDASARDYLAEIPARMPTEADAVWGNCEDYPGVGDGERFVRYMEDHRLRPNLFVAGYPNATLPDVREALDARRRLRDLVARAQSMTAEELQAAFREARLAG